LARLAGVVLKLESIRSIEGWYPSKASVFSLSRRTPAVEGREGSRGSRPVHRNQRRREGGAVGAGRDFSPILCRNKRRSTGSLPDCPKVVYIYPPPLASRLRVGEIR